MSLKVTAYIWDNVDAKGTELLVLLALGDAANQEGVCWPSVATIARLARCSKKTVERTMQKFIDLGELQVYRGGFLDGRNQSNTYRLLMGGDTMSPPPERPGVAGVGTLVSPRVPSPVSPLVEPSVGTTIEPSAAGAADDGQLFAVPGEVVVPPDQKDAKVQIVWDHYCGHYGDKLRIKGLTHSRRKCIKSALKIVSEEEDILLKAIDGFVRFRQTKSGETSIESILSSRPGGSSLTELIEFWISQADDSPTMASSVPPILRERVSRRRLAVIESLQRPDDERKRREAHEAVEWLKANAKEKPVIEDGKIVRWERTA